VDHGLRKDFGEEEGVMRTDNLYTTGVLLEKEHTSYVIAGYVHWEFASEIILCVAR
jgi:hypothetical protein